MSRILRYENTTILEHLASQYVAGHLTQRVRQRVEALRVNNSELDQRIAHWSDTFCELHEVLVQPDFSKSQQTSAWQQIELGIQTNPVNNNDKPAFWQGLMFWRGVSFSSVAMMLTLTFFNITSEQASISPAYFASLSPTDTVASDKNKDKPVYVISVYKGTDEKPSTLVMQWVKNSQDKSLNEMVKSSELHIWSEAKGGQGLVYIGKQPKADAPIQLSKASWSAIKNSSRLLITTSGETAPDADNTRFEGLCLQLKSWKT